MSPAAAPPAPPVTPERAAVAGIVPLEDAVLIQRRLLKNRRYSPELQIGQGELPYQAYPYTKGPDLSNDGIGYGEILSVDVCRLKECIELTRHESPPELHVETGFSRRTRSGRQVIGDDDPGVRWSK
jgi:hypothetical protein